MGKNLFLNFLVVNCPAIRPPFTSIFLCRVAFTIRGNVRPSLRKHSMILIYDGLSSIWGVFNILWWIDPLWRIGFDPLNGNILPLTLIYEYHSSMKGSHMPCRETCYIYNKVHNWDVRFFLCPFHLQITQNWRVVVSFTHIIAYLQFWCRLYP